MVYGFIFPHIPNIIIKKSANCLHTLYISRLIYISLIVSEAKHFFVFIISPLLTFHILLPQLPSAMDTSALFDFSIASDIVDHSQLFKIHSFCGLNDTPFS